ncbi:MAG: hypothetical protein VXW22_15750 [Pseudomonadota bacterium]|nr:hypothetical protein [Pseudomonadota bacterium]
MGGKIKVIESNYYSKGGSHEYGTMTKKLMMFRNKWLIFPMLKTYELNEFKITPLRENAAEGGALVGAEVEGVMLGGMIGGKGNRVVLLLETEDGKAVIEMKPKDYTKLMAQQQIHG